MIHVRKKVKPRFPRVFTMEGFLQAKGPRSSILLFTIFLCVAGGYYFTFVKIVKIDYASLYSPQEFSVFLNYFSLQVLYTNLFYIPIVLSAVWYRKKVIPLAVLLGFFHVYLTYSALGTLILGTIERAGIFVLLAYVIALISEGRAKEEMNVRRSEEKYRSLVESTADVIYIVDETCRYLFVNNMFLSQFGLVQHQIIGKTFSEFHGAEETKKFAQHVGTVFETGKATRYEAHSKKSGRWVIKTLSPIKEPPTSRVIAASVIVKDITKRKKAEEDVKRAYNELKKAEGQLIHNEKMVAVGRLTSGVAHQMRNPLSIILMGIDYLDSALPEKDEHCARSIKLIKQAVGRANKIVVDILQFSRKHELRLESVDVCKLLDDTIALVARGEHVKNISIQRKYPDKPIRCKGDRNTLQQVFINLMINAIDAMQAGGKMNLNAYYSLASRVHNKVGKRTTDYFTIGDRMVVVEIEDTGEGIPADMLPRIFEPFFSTKEIGKGTGLGLSLAYLIIDRHHGCIDVKSELNKGTQFIINLQPSDNQGKGDQLYEKEKDFLN
jgi:PAS domain S-box-containing protein